MKSMFPIYGLAVIRQLSGTWIVSGNFSARYASAGVILLEGRTFHVDAPTFDHTYERSILGMFVFDGVLDSATKQANRSANRSRGRYP
jgi:hypothetical protein